MRSATIASSRLYPDRPPPRLPVHRTVHSGTCTRSRSSRRSSPVPNGGRSSSPARLRDHDDLRRDRVRGVWTGAPSIARATLSDRAPRFAISHSGDWSTLADSRDGDHPGVDAERPRDRVRLQQGRALQRCAGPWQRIPDVVVARRDAAGVHRISAADRRRYLGARSAHARRAGRSCARCSMKRGRASRPTADGSPTCRTSPDAGMSTCNRSSGRAAAFACRRTAARGRRGRTTAPRSTSPPAATRWRRPFAPIGLAAAAPAIVQPGGTRAAWPGRPAHRPRLVFGAGRTRPTELIALPNFVRIDTLDDPRVAAYRHIADPRR